MSFCNLLSSKHTAAKEEESHGAAAAEAEVTSFTKQGDVDNGWILLGEESTTFTYADIASGKRIRDAQDLRDTMQEYVVLPTAANL
ncbi:hypothetical protein AC1031_006003 [Aphanomyces cochlioides]|nr:hypothetical protein AC1031_006003 [Aphanomyces cochlioides]